MREYKNIITLTKNCRGIWSLDTIIGCNSGLKYNKKGCFSDCYAARNSKTYGYDFSKNVLRFFKNDKHKESIIRKINKIDFPFIRVGNSGDPSEDWNHTIYILEQIKSVNKQFVIITKHWNKLNKEQLNRIKKLNICINTSISAIDNNLYDNIAQYELLKDYCKSILRCVSFDFNLKNNKGSEYYLIQNWIFQNYEVLDTVFRCGKSNEMYKKGLINIKETKFLGKKCYISKMNRKTYFGNCINCLEKCGLNDN